MKKSIGLYLGVTQSMGGVFQYSQTLLDAVADLPPEDFDVVVAYSDPVWCDAVESCGMRGIFVKHSRLSTLLGVALTCSGFPISLWKRIALVFDPVARQLKREDVDLWVFSALSFVCYQMPVPAVGVIHDLMHRYERRFPKDYPTGTYWWRERVFKRMCRWTKALLVDSELGKQHVVESYGADDGKIYPLRFIASVGKEIGTPGSFDERYSLPAKFFIYPSQFWEHKNHMRLLAALKSVKSMNPDVHLALAGSQSRGYEEVRARVEELDLQENVSFLGYVPQDDLHELYRRARALVMPTFFGPTNIPPLEAFRVGCPVAVSDIYGMPEQVGSAGLLFDPESADGMAAIIKRLWIDDAFCAELSKKGLARAAMWGPRQFNERFRQVLEECIGD